MAEYNYIEGKKRIIEILEGETDTQEVDKIPSMDSFTFDNGYKGWVTALFIDLRDSTKLFAESENKTDVAKIIRSFTSEIIDILRKDENIREIGIRGDCVYAIYTCSSKDEDYEIFEKSIFVNTFCIMLNRMLADRNLKTIKYGIGVATGIDLVVKAGREHTGINSLVWIGKAVNYASHLSNLGGTDNYCRLLFSDLFMVNLKKYAANNPELVSFKEDWFVEYSNEKLGTFYGAELHKVAFNNWIKNGMPDEER